MFLIKMKEVHNFIFILFKKTIWKIFLKKSPKCFKIKVYLFLNNSPNFILFLPVLIIILNKPTKNAFFKKKLLKKFGVF